MKGQMQRHYCPVCWQYVLRTTSGNTRRHMDSLGGDTCPYSGHPYDATIQGRNKPRQRQQFERRSWAAA